jgi:DNA-binding transcriptional MerR regulator
MDDFLQKHFTTGQFAALYGVSKRTLMYYDSIDLFKPAVVKENGYRYYTFGQSGLFDAIQLLRKLQVPLEEIKQHLAHCTPETSQKLLTNQHQLLEQQINELTWLKRVVQTKINNLSFNPAIDYTKLEVVEVQEQPILISSSLCEIPFEQAMKIILSFMQDCYHSRTYSGYPCGYMLDAKKLQQKDFSQFTNCFYRIDEKNNASMNWSYKPAGHYLVGYYKGDWTEIDQSFQQLVQYANEHSLTFSSHAYVESILDDTTAVAEDPYYCEARISVLLEYP